MVGFCLNSQQIRQKIIEGSIITCFDDISSENNTFNDQNLESKIQPSSFEPRISNEVFILDTETKGVFRPQTDESIYRTLLQLPGRQRQHIDITNGFELKKGFTYLLPLEERVILSKNQYIKSSPKSSLGRLFLNTRLLTDYNPCFDEVNYQYASDIPLNLWLLVQPLAFNVMVHPGLTLNQWRFFQGLDAKLTAPQISKEFSNHPILYSKTEEDSLEPVIPMITDGLQIHLDLSGQNTEGIVGLRARHNPTTIDLSKTEEYGAEYFFEPMFTPNGRFTIETGEHYLLGSREVLNIPSKLNVELEAHSHIGLTGPLHFAGFIDNGFNGDLVFEVRSDEKARMELVDGMPISKLNLFRTSEPDKLYGGSIGSNYYGQVGPRPAKYFKPFDFVFAARNYEKLDRDVLVQDAVILNSHRVSNEEFQFIDKETATALLNDINSGFFQSRYDCEFDELVLQPIPYMLFFGPNDTVFSYVRTSQIEDYGDERLFGKHSIGVGGHVTKADGPNYISRCIERENDEEVRITGEITEPKFVGTLMAYDTPVDRVHFGLIFASYTSGMVKPDEASFVSGRMVRIEELTQDSQCSKKFETWSRILIPHLMEIYEFSKP